MKKSLVSLCMWSIALIVACGGASTSLAQGKGSRLTWGGASPSLNQADGLNKYRGEWGCSSKSPVSFFGPVAGLWLLRLDPSGNVTGEETVASADPFIELSATFSGRLILQANGALRGTLSAHVTDPPGLPDSTFSLLCIGMDTQGDRYREMHCLDVTDEPAGTDVEGLVTCKNR